MQKHEFIRQTSDAFQQFYREGFITHRDGNACLALDNGKDFFVTASGIDKTYLSVNDFLEVNDKCELIWNDSLSGNEKPSIETAAHIVALVITGKQVSIHVHSPKTIALFEVYDNKKFTNEYKFNWTGILENEIMTNWPELFRYTKLGKTVPFLPPGSKELHKAIEDSFLTDTDIIVLQRHGILAVGNTVQEVLEHIMRLEHISSILLDIEKCK